MPIRRFVLAYPEASTVERALKKTAPYQISQLGCFFLGEFFYHLSAKKRSKKGKSREKKNGKGGGREAGRGKLAIKKYMLHFFVLRF